MKTITEFNAFDLKTYAAKVAEWTAAGKTPEEILAAVGEAKKLEGDKLKLYMQGLDIAKARPEGLKRIIVFTAAEGEKTPGGAEKREDHFYLAEFFPLPPEANRGKGRGGDRERGGGKGGRGKGRGGKGGRGDRNDRGRGPRPDGDRSQQADGRGGAGGEGRGGGRRPPFNRDKNRGPRPGGPGANPAAAGTLPKPRTDEEVAALAAKASAPTDSSDSTPTPSE